jgi:hypothetical protein
MHVHIGESLSGNCEQADGCAFIILSKKDISEELKGSKYLMSPSETPSSRRISANQTT